MISGIVIYFTHWTRIDPLLSIFISLLILISSLRLLGESLSSSWKVSQKHIKIKDVQTLYSRIRKCKFSTRFTYLDFIKRCYGFNCTCKLNKFEQWDKTLKALQIIFVEKI